MFDKLIYEKIFNAIIFLKQLEKFTTKMSKKDFDTDNSFYKYYNLDLIENVVNKYNNKEITDKYLSHWCLAM